MSRKSKIISLVIFTVFYILTRFPRSGSTIVNTDEVYWYERSQNFSKALSTKNYVETYQKYHPGVTLMWEMSLTAKVMSIVRGTSVSDVFADFEEFHVNVQFLLSVWFFVLLIIIIILLFKITEDWWFSIFSVFILMMEPFYIGNSRLIHHDVQSSLYILAAILLVYLYVKKNLKVTILILASLFLALSALSKTLYFGAFLFSLFSGILMLLLKKQIKKAIIFFFTIFIGFALFYILLFPALWVAPKDTIKDIISDSFVVGEEEGHTQIFFGEETRRPGPAFYPVLFILKSSPFIIAGFGLFLSVKIVELIDFVKERKKIRIGVIPLILFITIFYLGYFLAITYFDKKVDRYFVPIYPYLAITSAYGWDMFFRKKILTLIPLSIFLVFTVVPLITIFPHYLMYVNPLIGDAKKANEIIGQKLFGIGVFDLRDYIVEKYGDDRSIGSNDHGPLSSIYPNGKVYNVKVEHPNSFTIMVLGPNKDFPLAMKRDNRIKFRYVDSIVINGLEFWRIYKKAY